MGCDFGSSFSSANGMRDKPPQGTQIGNGERAQRTENKSLLDGRDYWLEYGRFDESGGLPICDERFAETKRRSYLARNRHDDKIAPAGVVTTAGNDGAGRFFAPD